MISVLVYQRWQGQLESMTCSLLIDCLKECKRMSVFVNYFIDYKDLILKTSKLCKILFRRYYSIPRLIYLDP